MRELILWCYHCKAPIGNTGKDTGEELRCPICNTLLGYQEMECDTPEDPITWEVEPLIHDRTEVIQCN